MIHTPLQSDIWFKRYEQFFEFQNNVKHRNMTSVLGYNSKSILATSDSFLLIMSHIVIVTIPIYLFTFAKLISLTSHAWPHSHTKYEKTGEKNEFITLCPCLMKSYTKVNNNSHYVIFLYIGNNSTIINNSDCWVWISAMFFSQFHWNSAKRCALCELQHGFIIKTSSQVLL